MKRHGRQHLAGAASVWPDRHPSRAARPTIAVLLLVLTVLYPAGCAHKPRALTGVPLVRVRLAERVSTVTLTAADPALFHAASDNAPRRLRLPAGGINVVLSPGGWKVGDMTLGTGELTIRPQADGSVRVNKAPYRGNFRLVPVGPGLFDIVNDVDIEGYLKGVVSRELLWNWHDQTYKAQAIVARTYALYECRTATAGRHYDVNSDVSSQVYGGLDAETAKSRAGVDATAGIVVAYGPPGQEKIFHAYFSSCCGGISQNVEDVFDDPYIEPLSDRYNGALCSASPRYNWGPVVVRKDELTRRFRAWGALRGRPEKDIGPIVSIEIEKTNSYGRPTRFRVHDARGYRYSLTGEETRTAINASAPGTTVYSSFFKVINDPDVIRFVDGHGWGHGVGMCQWCSQTLADQGNPFDAIIRAAYPKSKLIRAY